MARSYGQIQHRIWADPEFKAMGRDPQHMYLMLLSQPSMNQAGVLPLQVRKWAGNVADWDVNDVCEALQVLAERRYVVVDEDTEEVLIRTFIRGDGSFKIPGVLKSALTFAVATQSRRIRAVLASELRKLPPLVGKKGEEGQALVDATVASLEPIPDGFPDPIPEPIPERFLSNPSGNPSPMGRKQPIPEPIGEPPLSGSGSVSRSSLVDFWEGGTSAGDVRTAAGPASNAPPRCIRHNELPEGDEPPCGACKRLRENWETTRTQAAKHPPLPPLCGQCDNRWVQPDDDGPAQHCPRCHPLAVRQPA